MNLKWKEATKKIYNNQIKTIQQANGDKQGSHEVKIFILCMLDKPVLPNEKIKLINRNNFKNLCSTDAKCFDQSHTKKLWT